MYYKMEENMINCLPIHASPFLLPQRNCLFFFPLPRVNLYTCVFKNVCVCVRLLQQQAALISHKIQEEKKKSPQCCECGAQYAEHIMLLCLWRQINSCIIVGHNEAEKASRVSGSYG